MKSKVCPVCGGLYVDAVYSDGTPVKIEIDGMDETDAFLAGHGTLPYRKHRHTLHARVCLIKAEQKRKLNQKL